MEKENISKEEEVRIKLSLFCPHCNKKVSGYTAKEVEWNYDIHLKSCESKIAEKQK